MNESHNQNIMSDSTDQIVFIPLISPLHNPVSTEKVVSEYKEWLEGHFDAETHQILHSTEVQALRLRNTAGIIALVVTGGTERLIQSIANRGIPTLILAHESMNSLPASLEALAIVGTVNPTRLVFGRNNIGLDNIKLFVKSAKALKRIRRYRIGLIGGPSPWLIYSLPDKKELTRHLSIKLVEISMEEFKAEYALQDTSSINGFIAKAKSQAPIKGDIDIFDFRKSITIYLALKRIADNRNLKAISLKCFDIIEDFKATGCYAISMLNNQGFVAGCEGDVPATTTMIVLE